MSVAPVQLGDIATLQAGFGFPPSLQGRTTGQFPFAKVGDISRCGRSEGSILSSADHYVDAADVAALRAKIVPPGSILFAKIGEAIRQNHRVVAGCEMLIDNNAMAAIPNGRVESRFLYHYLKTVDFYSLAPATTVPALRKSDLERLQVPLPPLPEQRRIAAILDQADALRAKRRKSLAQLDSLTQSIFIEMFGDPVENPKGWQKRQLGTICEVGSSKRVFVEELVDEGIPFYRGTEVGQLGEDREVTPSLFISVEHYERLKSEAGVPRPGDLLLPSICPDGRIFSVESEQPFYFKDGRVLWIKASQSSMNSLFLRSQLKQLFAKNYAQIASGTTFAELKIFALKDAELCEPPLDLQLKFARVANCLKLQLSRSRSSLDEMDALFFSLQQRAFNGQLS